VTAESRFANTSASSISFRALGSSM
jgi:hypothetical protein